MSQTNGFLRSKLKEPNHLNDLIAKLTRLVVKKKNAFNVDFKGVLMAGEDMTNVDFTTSATQVTFTYKTINYVLIYSNVKIVKRLRSRKFQFKTNVLAVAP